MSASPQFVHDQNGAQPGADAALVREQLRRLLAHPLFTNSKRYPVLLAYTVEQKLAGNAGNLKERTIGVEAFGREPSYDVNLDPVVRMTASEVRKRLIQYYYNPDHAGELVIELPVGSYVPSFREPEIHQPVAAGAAVSVPIESASEEAAPSATISTPENAGRAGPGRWMMVGVGLVCACLFGFAVGRHRLSGPAAIPHQPTNMERFWAPITSASGRVTYCLGEPGDAVDLKVRTTFGVAEDGSLNVYDVVTLARSIVPLVPRNSQFRVLAASATGYSQLREGPFVLIGAFDNPWTMRITQNLPFGFEYDDDLRKIVDRKSRDGRFWTLRWAVPNTKLSEDYAVVARINDKITGQPVIVLAGILGEGTEAASEVVSNPLYLNQLLEKAPKNWDKLNLEAVIQTHVIQGHPGPPTVVAVETW